MKLWLRLGLAALALICVVPRSTQASAASDIRFVGTVTYQGQPTEGVRVYINCPQAGDYAKSPTDTQGNYEMTLPSVSCPIGADVKVWVISDKLHLSGWTFSKITGATTRVDVELRNLAPQVPEYGWLAGALATGAGVSVVMYTRRRYMRP